MKESTSMNRMIIIYLPNGNEAKFTTSNSVSNTEYKLISTIVCKPNLVNIGYKEDGIVRGEVYAGMPYIFEMW